MSKRRLLSLFAASVTVGCSAEEARLPSAEPKLTTIAALMAGSELHDGEVVRIKGPAVGMFEVSYFCDTLEEIEYISSGCLWIEPGELALSDYHQKVIELVGRLDRRSTGHMGAYAGSIHAMSVSVVGKHSLGVPPPLEQPVQ